MLVRLSIVPVTQNLTQFLFTLSYLFIGAFMQDDLHLLSIESPKVPNGHNYEITHLNPKICNKKGKN